MTMTHPGWDITRPTVGSTLGAVRRVGSAMALNRRPHRGIDGGSRPPPQQAPRKARSRQHSRVRVDHLHGVAAIDERGRLGKDGGLS